MVHIISKRDGPRKEDVEIRSFLDRNRATIDGLADRLTGGAWREMRNPKPPQQPDPSGTLWFTPPSRPQEAEPYVRISLNGRVVVADLATGRQLQFLGAVAGRGEGRHFALATRENGFFEPIEAEAGCALADLDGVLLPDGEAEDMLKQEIAVRLGLAPAREGAG
ncbi:hypothetical protein [Labrys monachus]|uniref:Uncharacterized protein n=1 Tax=Labrys monachus TaxID=217067 RepID=A0ABU0FBD3_9HYPH|nr:hypothetical protein [Labrys monachus]MDQ0391928.1 hypothetical protein [Labrys monachus]